MVIPNVILVAMFFKEKEKNVAEATPIQHPKQEKFRGYLPHTVSESGGIPNTNTLTDVCRLLSYKHNLHIVESAHGIHEECIVVIL